MRLLLVRHAEAVDLHAEGTATDFHRRLTERGQAQVAALVNALKIRQINPQSILTSPLIRAVETAEPIAQALTPGKEFLVTEWLALDALRPKKLSRLIVQQGVETVLLVGHMPDISDYAAWLLDSEEGSLHFDKGAIASIQCPHMVAKGAGTLEWLIPTTWYS